MPEVVALLRSVNVGGNRMKMDRLRSVAGDVGCTGVRTVLATGNIVMSPPEDLDATRQALEEGLAQQFGVIAVVMRTHASMLQAVRDNPWAREVEGGVLEGRAVHTMFCGRAPSETAVADLPKADSDDHFAVVGSHAYLKLAGSAAETPYTGAWFERHLGVVGTMRNHNTVLKLVEATG